MALPPRDPGGKVVTAKSPEKPLPFKVKKPGKLYRAKGKNPALKAAAMRKATPLSK